MKRILYTIIFLWVAVTYTHAQQHCFFTHYSTEDGLSQNTVMSILQDHKDNLWFATWDGINRFDGYTFKVYKARQGNYISLANNRVDRLYEDCNGFLWLMTYDNRVHRFDPRTETFEQVPKAGDKGSYLNIHRVEVLANGTVWLFTENDGAIRVTISEQGSRFSCDIYSAESGLFPALYVNRVYLDKAGNEWLLTDNGLGMIPAGEKRAISYFVDTSEKAKGLKQAFYAVMETETDLCFGSDRGRIWCYKKKDGEFSLLEIPTKARVTSIHMATSTQAIVTTDKDGFFSHNLKTKANIHYSPITCKELPDKPILSAYVDRHKEVWFEQEEPGVVAHFNPATGIVKCERVKTEYSSAERSRPAFHIHEDVNGYLWVHPFGGGFSYFDREKNSLVPFYNELGSREWKFSNKIHSAFSDKQGNLWLSSHTKGLEKITFRNVPFSMLTPEPHEYESINNEVRSLFEDKEGNLWVGLKDGMIRVYDAHRKYMGYLTASGTISLSGTPVKGTAYFIMQDSKGIMWIATKGDGLIRAERTGETYKLTRFLHNEDDMYSLSDNNVYCVYEDHYGRIWVATFAGGINYLSKSKDGATVFINHRNNLKGYPIDPCNKTRFITSDNNGHLWVGTTTGAITFAENFKKPEDLKFYHFSRVPNDTKSLSNNDVHWILPTRKQEIYLATFGGGLNKVVSISKDGHGEFKSYSVIDGLPSDVLLSMREDSKGYLWLSTENGICKFNPNEERFENFDERSITFPVRFSEAASTLTSRGEMMFGSSNGIFIFSPDSIRKSSYVPPIVFSKLMIANQTVDPGENSLLTVDLDDTRELTLSHDENIFSVQYAALDFTNPQSVQYMYKLEGLEKEWILADKQRSVTYTNLAKGHYVFRVRSTNSDGVWVNNERTLDIVILPSFWETPLAFVLYVCMVLLIIFITVYILFTIYRLKHEVSVEQQISDIKLRFFTNISHELRTPLTLIVGPVEQVLRNDKLPADVHEQLVVVERNTNRMLRLVNQILDFRKIQNKKMKMQVQQVDVVSFVRRVMENFEAVAEEHHIDFLFQAEKSQLYLWLDVDKLEKIVFNLLSNAFKYTPKGKMITVFVREDEHTVSIGVQDQGIGIAEGRKKSLFVRFENLVDRHSAANQASTGIGLSLVKELVEMHKATITVDSHLGEGSCFKIDFLKGKEHYDKEIEFILDDTDVPLRMGQVVDIANSSILSETTVTDEGETFSVVSEVEESEVQETDGTEIMLLVEDNQELRNFLRSLFSSTYRVIEAVDGIDGWSKALKYLPDIIISDVMMPGKDGIELTRELREEMTTSHIPIILLTAKTTIESKLEGLEYGADDYITKPFSATYLQARVENLLAQRRKLQDYYRDSLMSIVVSPAQPVEVPVLEEGNVEEEILPEEPMMPEMSSNDRKFMEKLVELMEQHIDNGELVVDDLVRELAVSRSVFFKKLKTLTGLAPIEFIKEMRIKRAAQLIESGEFNMTQISYMVGINDPRYFSKCFKAKTGMTPTEYRDKIGR
ncbi:signal transduction histidine kinase/ligand-binding sensor domain-containing protein/DNA-binding response OmpR family regulator [Bacteroides reticulotermitis]|nr:signal transduction histidine kinase/ligand-binding sensor domain-containing protein/DNA-binding response OmpR family regulator [Bacteroides reticulotermitis]